MEQLVEFAPPQAYLLGALDATVPRPPGRFHGAAGARILRSVTTTADPALRRCAAPAAPRRGVPVLTALLALAVAPTSARAQHAATLPPLDPAYRDVERLEAFGLVPRGVGGPMPWSRGRVAWMVREARALLAARADLPPEPRRDLTSLLDRLEARFGASRASRLAATAEVEAGGGRSPGVAYPYDALGDLDAVLNPLWSGRGGRVYGDEWSVAGAGRVDLPLGARGVLSAGGRVEAGGSGGLTAGRDGVVAEGLHTRFVVGRLGVQAGRDHVWTGPGPDGGGLLGLNGPPLDLVRLATDRPLPLHLLGDTDLSFFVADLGAAHVFPHAKLIGALFAVRPAAGLDVGVALLNKQGGEGAPEATLGQRVRDLFWVVDWFQDEDPMISDKMAALHLRQRFERVALFGELTLTDFDYRRRRYTFVSGAGYRVGVSLPRLGSAERAGVHVEAARVGPLVYRHHQFTTGSAVDGFVQGSLPGPDSRALTARFTWDAPASGWNAELRLTREWRNGDVWFNDDLDPDRLRLGTAMPDETRLRGEARLLRSLRDGAGGLEVRAGIERARNFAHVEGAARWNRAGVVRVWWGI